MQKWPENEYIRGLFKKYREFWIFAGYVYSIFDLFVALCWYSYPSLMSTSSDILIVQLIFDGYFAWMCFNSSSVFASSVSETRQNHKGPDPGNTMAAATLLCCLWPKIRAQATMWAGKNFLCGKFNFCYSTNPGVSGEFLRANFA